MTRNFSPYVYNQNVLAEYLAHDRSGDHRRGAEVALSAGDDDRFGLEGRGVREWFAAAVDDESVYGPARTGRISASTSTT